MKFFYTALTTDNKKITGVLDAPDRDTAQGELHKMGVAILSVNEISEEESERIKREQEEQKAKSGIKTFQFLAVDANAKEIEGTIDAVDDFSAYKRLREEYQFKVVNLFPEMATEAEKVRTRALIPGFEDQLSQQQAFGKKDEKKSASQEAGELGEEDLNKEIIMEIDRVIVNTKKALETHASLYSTDLLLEVQTTLSELERIRTSNNIKHITEVSNDLYSLVSNPDKADAEAMKSEEYQSLMSEIHESALVKKDFEMYKKAIEASGLKRLFGDMSKRLREITAPKKDEKGEPTGAFAKFKASLHGWLEKRAQKKMPKRAQINGAGKPKSKIGELFEKLGAYFKATSPILKQTRQRELMDAVKRLFGGKKTETVVPGEPEKPGVEAEKKAMPAKKGVKAPRRKGRDFTGFFVEVDSFVGWLLCFYILYFFMVDFSLEKKIGLGREFVYKTLKTPLLLNVTLLLLLFHFMLRIRNLHFRGNSAASLFLFFFGAGIYILTIVNF